MRQEEEEMFKTMKHLKEEQERRREKEMKKRRSLGETKEQILKSPEKLWFLQEKKRQRFLQLGKESVACGRKAECPDHSDVCCVPAEPGCGHSSSAIHVQGAWRT